MSAIGQGSISIDDSMEQAQNAQDTANDVKDGVIDINSDNKLTPGEKNTLKRKYETDKQLYEIDVSQLQSVSLPTTEIDAAMSALTDYVNPLFKDMQKTDVIDRNALNKVFSNFDEADKNASQAFVNMVQQVADDAKIAGEDAKAAGEDAKNSAKKAEEDASKAVTEANSAQQKAQSSIDQLNNAQVVINQGISDAKKTAQDAKDSVKIVDTKVDNLSDSTMAQFNTLNNGYQFVLNSINNLDVGGRNYLLNSDVTTNVFQKLSSSTKTSYFNGKKIAVSVEIEIKNVKSISSNSNNRVGYEAIWVGDNGKNYYPGTWKVFTNDDIGKSFKLRIGNYFDFTNVTFKDNENNECGALYVQGISADLIKVGKPKLEIGTKVTDWTPAPEDLAKETEITVIQGLIDQKVSNDQYQSDKTQTADLISQTVTNAVGDINIGSRNYLLATSTPFTKTIDTSAGDIYDFNYWYSFGELNKAPFKKGMEVMWSFDWEVSNMTSYGQIEMYLETSPFTVNKVIGSVGPKDLHVSPSPTNTSGHVEVYATVNENFLKNASKQFKHGVMKPFKGTLTFKNVQLVIGNKSTGWSPAPEDTPNGISNLVINSGYPTGTEHWKVGGPAKSTFRVAKHVFYHNGNDNTFNLINHGAKADLECYVSSDRFPVKANSKYVLSFKGFASSNVSDMDVWFLGRKYGSGADYDKTIKILGPKKLSPSSVEKVEMTFDTADCDEGYIRFDNNGSSDGKDSSLYFTEIKVEKGAHATEWSVSPRETATSTEINQLSNAIQLKANSSDVTSQINVAVKGVQTDVTNKISNLTTQINQTSDAIQLLSGTVGSRNLVYNATFEQKGSDFPYGWIRSSNASNETGYTSGVPVSSYQGRHSIGVNTSKELGWVMFAQSNPQPLPVDNSVDAANNVYSASMMVKVYRDSGAKDNGHVHVVLAFFDANKKRIESNIKGVWSKTAKESNEQWHMVKVENFAPSANAKYVAIQAFAYGTPTHAMVNQPMINIGTKVQPFKADVVNQATITESINNINLKVANADGSYAQVNINNNTILLDANKINFNGNVSIKNGTIGNAKIADAAINSAKIANLAVSDSKISNLNGNKIIAGTITAKQMNANDIIANVINGKTITGITVNTPKLNLGMNGTFSEDYNFTQDTGLFLPKKGQGNFTLNHGVLQSRGSGQTFAQGAWGGMDDNRSFKKGLTNNIWSELGPSYQKFDMYKQDKSTVLERTYVDPTGFYYTTTGNQAYTSYVGNIVSTPQVQTASVVADTIDIFGDKKRLEIGHSGSRIGLQVGSYAGKEAVLSDFIYDFTSSTASNVYITSNGHLARTTSASKYKYNISNPDYEDVLGDRLLNVHLASWNDKNAIDSYVHTLNTGEDTEKISIDKYHGLIAEQLRDAGLEMFVEYNEDGEIEGIQYDRAWIPLLAVVRRLNNKINEYEMRISKLEEKNE